MLQGLFLYSPLAHGKTVSSAVTQEKLKYKFQLSMLVSSEVLDTILSISYCYLFHFLITDRLIDFSMILDDECFIPCCISVMSVFLTAGVYFSGTSY